MECAVTPLESTNLPPPPPAKTAGRTRGSLVIIRPDGSEGDRVELRDQTVVGRSHGEPFASDMYLSPKHAFFFFRDDSLFVQDVSSLNGVYLRITPDVPHPLADRAIFRIGQEIIRFERMLPPELDEQGVETMGSPNPGYLGRIALVTGRESVGNSYCIPSEGMHLGRERGDIIFPDDGYVSGLHCRVHGKPDQVWVTDVGSSNGTLVRVDKESVVLRGTIVLLGQQLFRADY